MITSHNENLPVPMPRRKHIVETTPIPEPTISVKEVNVALNVDPPSESPPPSPTGSISNPDERPHSPSPDVVIDDVFKEAEVVVNDVTEVVPPLDLSGMTSSEEVRPKPVPKRESPSRAKRRRRKRSKASPDQVGNP